MAENARTTTPEIDVTPEMIAAGTRVLLDFAATEDPVDAVREIYAAMEASRRATASEAPPSACGRS